jgi:GTPase SAR1 family protein
LIIPGTTISLTLTPTYVEVRDKGTVKKKIPLKDRSFDDVALELQKYVRYLGKRLAPGVLEDVLVRIGLPKARRVLKEPVLEKPQEPAQEPAKQVVEEKPSATERETAPAATFIEHSGVSADESGAISVDDFDDISDALEAVESLSDSFMAGAPVETPVEKKKVKAEISINLAGTNEILASEKSYVRVGEIKPLEEDEKEEEATETESPEIIAETVAEEAEVEIKPETHVTPAHQIKPVVECKALLLGEDGVGKESLKLKANFEPHMSEDGSSSEHIFSRMFEGMNHRIDMRVWSFDLAVKAKVQRKEFYRDSQALIIVYSASDRWSFESIDFWLREATLATEEMPPMVIVANKIDLRSETGEDSGDEPVSHDEGFKFAEELAERYSKDNRLHPVAFIETSCVTGEGVEEVFETASQLFEKTISYEFL